MAVADIASRYLVPAIDCGGLIEGADGVVTCQLVQIVRFLAADPCPVCRGMISPLRVEQELLPTGARLDAATQVAKAAAAGVRHDPILSAIPQIDTVGYRSEEHTSELQSLMRISYAVFCLKKKKEIRCKTRNTANQTNRLSKCKS